MTRRRVPHAKTNAPEAGGQLRGVQVRQRGGGDTSTREGDPRRPTSPPSPPPPCDALWSLLSLSLSLLLLIKRGFSRPGRPVVQHRGERAWNLNLEGAAPGERGDAGLPRINYQTVIIKEQVVTFRRTSRECALVCVRLHAAVHVQFISGACVACLCYLYANVCACVCACVCFPCSASPLCQSRAVTLLISAFICIAFILRVLSLCFTGHKRRHTQANFATLHCNPGNGVFFSHFGFTFRRDASTPILASGIGTDTSIVLEHSTRTR